MERFIFHHPQLYRQMLIVALGLCLLTGVGSTFDGNKLSAVNSRSFASVIGPNMEPPKPPQSASASVNAPKGWEATTKLPGTDGSGKPATPLAPAPESAAARAAIPLNSGSAMTLGRELNAVAFGDQYWPALQALWNRESNWNPNARNPTSGACGIPQALPCAKITDMSPQGQIEWGLQYIRSRYGDPNKAWQFWLAHHWY